MASAMEIDDEENDLPTSSSAKGEKKRFEVKKVFTWLIQKQLSLHTKLLNFLTLSHVGLHDTLMFLNFLQWNAVALWAWGTFITNPIYSLSQKINFLNWLISNYPFTQICLVHSSSSFIYKHFSIWYIYLIKYSSLCW